MTVSEIEKKPSIHSRAPDPIDMYVGQRLRLRRNLLDLSQEELGRASNLTFQQIQKYERGSNRMGASRLFQMGQILDVPVSWFYEGLPEEFIGVRRARKFDDNAKPTVLEGEAAEEKLSQQREMAEILHRRETADLLRLWYRIPDSRHRRKIIDLVKSLGDPVE